MPVTTVAPSTSTTVLSVPEPVRLVPYGSLSETPDLYLRVLETEVTTSTSGLRPGDVWLDYELGLSFDPQGRTGTVHAEPLSIGGELAVELSCTTPNCSFEPVNDHLQTSVHLTVRPAAESLTVGTHSVPFELRFDDGAVERFDVVLYADPGPSPIFVDIVAASTGEPELVQTVIGPGRFTYHAITAFESVWVLDRVLGTVTRIGAETGELLETIPIGESGGSRLTATRDAIWAAAAPAVRIDPTTNTATPLDTGSRVNAITTDGATMWVAEYNGPIRRIDTDETITELDIGDAPWVDLAYTNGLIWALKQSDGPDNLIAFEPNTGAIRHLLTVTGNGSWFPVRLVADETTIAVGTDTSGGGGRTGSVILIDAATTDIEATIELNSRPEGISLTPEHIWTNGAVIDRATLDVTTYQLLGFTITVGPDGSIWGFGGIPGSDSGNFVAHRYSPGQYAEPL